MIDLLITGLLIIGEILLFCKLAFIQRDMNKIIDEINRQVGVIQGRGK